MLLLHISSINRQCHQARTLANLCSKMVQRKWQAGVDYESPQEACIFPESLSLSFSAFFSSLTLSLHHTWKCGKGSQLWCAFPHASWEITAFFFFSKASQAEESCMTMCLWVIFIVSVAAHWAERGKRYHCNLKGSIAKDQLRWRREPRLNHCYSLMLVLKQHAINLVRNEEIKQRRQSSVCMKDGWVTPQISTTKCIFSAS